MHQLGIKDSPVILDMKARQRTMNSLIDLSYVLHAMSPDSISNSSYLMERIVRMCIKWNVKHHPKTSIFQLNKSVWVIPSNYPKHSLQL